jgi:UDPglucose 6-dehydrogenase
MSKFGILGYGYVGKATHKSLLRDGEVIIYDTSLELSKSLIYKADTVFICIPTNTKDDIDTIVQEIKDLQKHNPGVLIIIRSTLPLGSCNRIQAEVGPIIYIPEFLRERYWEVDCLRRPLVVGYDVEGLLPEWLTDEQITECSTAEAELVKMFSNNFAVMRIAFANVFYDLAESVGADYDIVKNMFFEVEHDQTYMEVPGHDGTRGFGGKCLPKDLDYLIDTLDQFNIDQNWFKHIRELNKGWKEKF